MGRLKYITYGICEDCGKTFIKRKPNGAYYADKRFCDKKCSSHYNSLHRKRPIRTAEWNKHIGDAQRGNKANNWQGGIMSRSSMLQSERKTKRYKKFRQEMFMRDSFICSRCNSKNKIELHHIKPYSTHKELAYEPSNVVTLCRMCHKLTYSFAVNSKYIKDK